jgi:hypothetical protein
MITLFVILLACSGSAEDPEKRTTATRGGSAVDPATYHHRSVHGAVTGPNGEPIQGATLLVGRSDGVAEEPDSLGETGEFVFHIREENSGPPPWTLTFAATGHASQTVTVAGPPPEEGLRFDIKLVPEG